MKTTFDRRSRRFHWWIIAMGVLVGTGLQVQLLNAASEELGTLQEMFKKNTPPTGITVRTKSGVEKDIVDILQRGMTANQVSDLLGKPDKVLVPTGGSGPPSLPTEWADAEEEWWIYPNRKTKDGRHLHLLFANRSGGKKTLFSVWLFPNQTEAEQDGADQPATAPESKPKGKDKPQPESKPAPR